MPAKVHMSKNELNDLIEAGEKAGTDTAQLKSYYPIALRLFSRLDRKITLAFLERYPTPEKAAKG